MWIKCKKRHRCEKCKHYLFVEATGEYYCILKLKDKEKVLRIILKPVFDKFNERRKAEKERVYANIMEELKSEINKTN